jgi:hypothetical protein
MTDNQNVGEALLTDRTTSGMTSGSQSNAGVNLVVGALTLLFFGTSSAAALPRPTPQILVSGATGSAGAIASLYPSGVATSASKLLELHRRSGLTWEEVAHLFRVERRTAHLWASGRAMKANQIQRLSSLLNAVRRVDQGTPRATREFLATAEVDGKPVIELLDEERFAEVAQAPVWPSTVAKDDPWRRMRRPPRLSPEATRRRRPAPLPELLGAIDDEAEG